MIIVNIYGGIGNQMFQYAFGKSLSIVKKQKLKLDTTSFEHYELREFSLNKFNLTYSLASAGDIKKVVITNRFNRFIIRKLSNYFPIKFKNFFEKKEFIFDSSVFSSNATYYKGYWQSFKYFENIRNLLIKEFSLSEPLDQANLEILNKIQNHNSVSIHFRRGDYVTLSKLPKGHSLSPISYYEDAITYISSRISNPYFFIFSDDICWVKENLPIKQSADYIDFNNDMPERDINLMKNCKHNIIANSSFSWWGAWLNENDEKIVIAPKKWMNNLESSRDLIDTKWIRF